QTKPPEVIRRGRQIRHRASNLFELLDELKYAVARRVNRAGAEGAVVRGAEGPEFLDGPEQLFRLDGVRLIERLERRLHGEVSGGDMGSRHGAHPGGEVGGRRGEGRDEEGSFDEIR